MKTKISLCVLLAVFLIALLSAFDKNFMPYGGEITAFEIIRVLGIDKSTDNPNEIEVTMIAERAKPSPGEEGGGMSYEVLSATGVTAFEAVAKLRADTDKKQVFGYIDYIIFGESAARDDITRYADFTARSPEIRYSPKVFIVRGGSAKELLSDTSSGDKYIGNSLDNMSMAVNLRSDFSMVRNIELMNMLDDSDTAAVIPALEAKPEEDEKLIDGEKPPKKLSAAGYAVLVDYKLAGWFDDHEARGYNFLTNGIRTGAFSVEYDGGEVALDVLSTGLKVTPRFDGERLTGVTYTVQVSANIAEQRSRDKLFTKASLSQLSAELAAAIESETEQVIGKSKDFGADCLKLGTEIEMRHPYKWRKQGNWREIFKDVDIDVKAETAVRRVYDLREPSGA